MSLKSTRGPKSKARKTAKDLAAAYPSLTGNQTPKQRGKALERRMRDRGLQPIRDFDRYLNDVSDFWPGNESCDEFLNWLRSLRHEASN